MTGNLADERGWRVCVSPLVKQGLGLKVNPNPDIQTYISVYLNILIYTFIQE